MRHVAILGVGIALTGCSLIYSPNSLPAPVDAQPIDADPSMLMVDSAGPAVLFEGQGADGSRSAILAITGKNFVAPVTVRVFATGSETPMIVVNPDLLISPASGVIAVSLTLPIDTAIASADIPLTIEVSQPGGADVITKTLTGAVTLRTLPELDKAITDSMALKPMYSRVNIPAPGGLTFTAASGKPRARIRSASTINLGFVNVSAAGNAAGPGGEAGGAAGKPGDGGASGGGGGGGVLGGGGGGAGFTNPGTDGSGAKGGQPTGDPLISDYATNISAGGGGGDVSGGSGGGTLELTARGDIHVGAITANGGAGDNGGLVAGGGGGAGGVVVIRCGGTATLGGAISALAGAAGGGTGGGGGAGSIGRTRVDAPMIVGSLAPDPPPANPPYHIGASFDPATPLVFTTQAQKAGIKLFGTVADKFDVAVLDSNGVPIPPTLPVDFGNATTITVKPTLQPGFNRVCVTKNGGSVAVAEATNCIDLAYLP